jgi:hypothetical protein
MVATCIFVKMLNTRERKKVQWNNQLVRGLKLISRWYVCSRGSRPTLDDWNSCKSIKIIRAQAWCRVWTLYGICSKCCGRRKKGISFVSPKWKIVYCNQGHQHNSWYGFSYKQKSMCLKRLSHFHKIHFKNSWESWYGEGCHSFSSL